MSTKNVKVNNTEKNAKVTKETLRNDLGALMPVLANSHPELALEIDKTLGKKTATFEVLEGLLNRAIEAGKTTSAPVENQVKPAPKKNIKKTTGGITKSKKTEKVETTPPAMVEETVPQIGDKLPVIKYFPEEISIQRDGEDIKLKRREDITSIAQLIEHFQKGSDFYLATYWTPAHIKKFDYDGMTGLPTTIKKTKAFKNNLDILNMVYACANFPRIYAASTYTDAMFMFEGEDFEYFEDVNPYREDEKFKTRASKGMEFEIYEVVVD